MYEFEIKPYDDNILEGQLNMRVGEDSLSIEGIFRLMDILDFNLKFAEYTVRTENGGIIYHYKDGKVLNGALLDIFDQKIRNGE
jgi:hypothetical protein